MDYDVQRDSQKSVKFFLGVWLFLFFCMLICLQKSLKNNNFSTSLKLLLDLNGMNQTTENRFESWNFLAEIFARNSASFWLATGLERKSFSTKNEKGEIYWYWRNVAAATDVRFLALAWWHEECQSSLPPFPTTFRQSTKLPFVKISSSENWGKIQLLHLAQ